MLVSNCGESGMKKKVCSKDDGRFVARREERSYAMIASMKKVCSKDDGGRWCLMLDQEKRPNIFREI